MARTGLRTSAFRAARALNELTKRRLAELAGVSYDTVCRAERGERISDVSAVKIARALGLEPHDLWPELREEAS